MERWFLAGAVAGLLILLFDKPLANEIQGEFTGQIFTPAVPLPDVIPPNDTTGSTCGCESSPAVAPAYVPPVMAPGAPPSFSIPILPPAQRIAPVYIVPHVYNNTPQQLGNRINPSATIPDIPNAKPKPMPFKATPLSPSPVIIGPANSQPIIGNRLHLQDSKSPAPKPVLVDPDFKAFYYN